MSFSPKGQMQEYRGIMNGYSFMEHGGMWADVFVISPMVAYLMSRHSFGYLTPLGLILLGVSLAIVIGSAPAYNKIGLQYPVAHSHDGRTTPAGYIHGLFAVVALWIATMFYVDLITPAPTQGEVLGITAILTPFFFLGMVDFNRRWKFIRAAKIQLVFEIAALWLIASVKIAKMAGQ